MARLGPTNRERYGSARRRDPYRARGTAPVTPREPHPQRGTGHPEQSGGLRRPRAQRDPRAVFGFIAVEKAHHAVTRMCRVLGVSRSGYDAWAQRPPSARAVRDAALSERMRAIHTDARGTDGTPDCKGATAGKDRVRRDARPPLHRLRTWSSATSRPLRRIPAGWRRSPRCRPGGAFARWPSCALSLAAGSSAGRWRTRAPWAACAPRWCAKRARWPSGDDDRWLK